MKKFMEEFKSFALRGNVVDLAIGVVIGAAFGKIVTSLVNDIIMPLISLIAGKHDLSNLKYVVVEASGNIPESAIRYGTFLQTVVDFIIIAFCIFLAIKFFNRFKKKQEETPIADPVPNPQEVLLAEIRDLLKEKRSL